MWKFIVATIAMVSILVACAFILFKVIYNAGYHFNDAYMTPDTTISIHNGHSDTVILKKSKPFWLN